MTGIRRSRKLHRDALHSEIDISPFFISAFSLLLIFMVGTARPDHNHKTFEMAKTRASLPMPAALRADAMKVGISASGDVYYRNLKFNLEELNGILHKGWQSGAERRVYLVVDGRTRYLDVKRVLDAIHVSGISDVSFITEQLPR